MNGQWVYLIYGAMGMRAQYGTVAIVLHIMDNLVPSILMLLSSACVSLYDSFSLSLAFTGQLL